MAKAKRRYGGDFALQQASSVLDQTMNFAFEKALREQESEARTNENFLSMAFQNELASQAKYKDFLLDEGVALPDNLRTSAYADIVEKATGDTSTLQTLQDLYSNAQTNTEQLQSIYSDFKAGQRLSESGAFKSFATSEDDKTDFDRITFSGQEYETLFESGKLGDLSGKNKDVFRQGFLAGNMDQKEALDYLAQENNYYNSKMATLKNNYSDAKVYGQEFLSQAENNLSELISMKGVPIAAFAQLSTSKDGFDKYQDEIDKITDGDYAGLTKNGRVSQILKETINKYALDPNKSTDAFGAFAEQASRIYNAYMQGTDENRKDMQDMFDDYVKLGMYVKDPVSGQIVPSQELVTVLKGYDNMDDIYENAAVASENLSEEFRNKGLDIGDVNTFKDNLILNQDLNADIASKFYNMSFDDVKDVSDLNLDVESKEINFDSVYDSEGQSYSEEELELLSYYNEYDTNLGTGYGVRKRQKARQKLGAEMLSNPTLAMVRWGAKYAKDPAFARQAGLNKSVKIPSDVQLKDITPEMYKQALAAYKFYMNDKSVMSDEISKLLEMSLKRN